MKTSVKFLSQFALFLGAAACAHAQRFLAVDANGNVYIPGNLSVGGITGISPVLTISGDANGSVTFTNLANGNLTLTLGNSGVTAGTLGNATTLPQLTVNAKGLVTGSTNVTIAPAFASITGKPTTLGGYGITDGQPLSANLTTLAGIISGAFGRTLLQEGSAASALADLTIEPAAYSHTTVLDSTLSGTVYDNSIFINANVTGNQSRNIILGGELDMASDTGMIIIGNGVMNGLVNRRSTTGVMIGYNATQSSTDGVQIGQYTYMGDHSGTIVGPGARTEGAQAIALGIVADGALQNVMVLGGEPGGDPSLSWDHEAANLFLWNGFESIYWEYSGTALAKLRTDNPAQTPYYLHLGKSALDASVRIHLGGNYVTSGSGAEQFFAVGEVVNGSVVGYNIVGGATWKSQYTTAYISDPGNGTGFAATPFNNGGVVGLTITNGGMTYTNTTHNIAGGDAYLVASQGTGTAAGGGFRFGTSPAGVTSNNLWNPIYDAFDIMPSGNVSLPAVVTDNGTLTIKSLSPNSFIVTNGNLTLVPLVTTNGTFPAQLANGSLGAQPYNATTVNAAAPAGNLVGDTDAQTLTNKTLSGGTFSGTVAGSPTFSGNPAFSGNVTGVNATLGANTTQLATTADIIAATPSYAISGSDFTITSTTVLTPVTGLSVNIVAGVTYEIVGHIEFNPGGTGAGYTLSLQLANSGNFTTASRYNYKVHAASSYIGTQSYTAPSAFDTGTSTNNTYVLDIDGVLVCNATGSVVFSAAQHTSNATSSTILKGSYLRVSPTH